MKAPSSPERLDAWWIAAGMVVWALHFGAIYGFTALACSRQMDAQVPWVVCSASLVAGVAAVMLILKGWRGRADFAGWMTAGTAALALLAILWESLAVLGVSPCGLR